MGSLGTTIFSLRGQKVLSAGVRLPKGTNSGGIRAPKQRYFVQGTGYPKGLGAGKYPSLQEPMCNVAIRITSTLALIKC